MAFAKGGRELVIKEANIFQTPDIGMMISSGAHFEKRNGINFVYPPFPLFLFFFFFHLFHLNFRNTSDFSFRAVLSGGERYQNQYYFGYQT